jgi:diguanylate cyclase (GGDEF)-like protein
MAASDDGSGQGDSRKDGLPEDDSHWDMPSNILGDFSEQPAKSFRLGRLWRQFLDRDLEREFQRYALSSHTISLRRMLVFGASSYLLWFSNDLILLGGFGNPVWEPMLLTRVFCAAALLGLFALMGRPGVTTATLRHATLVAYMVCLGGIHVLLWLLPAELLPLSVLMCLVTLTAYTLLSSPLYVSLPIAGAMGLAFVAVAKITRPDVSNGEWITLASVLAGTNIFGFMIGQDVQRGWRREFRSLVEQQRLAVRDHLTGAFNRRYLYDMALPAELERARRHKGWLSMVMCDLDHFKKINDLHGHPAGDAVLKAFAELLKSGTRSLDAVVRFGGEEFLLLLPGADAERAAETAERLRVALHKTPIQGPDGQRIAATASFGVCSAHLGGEEEARGEIRGHVMIAAADHYLYQAKQAGRNVVRCGGHQPGLGTPG